MRGQRGEDKDRRIRTGQMKVKILIQTKHRSVENNCEAINFLKLSQNFYFCL